MDIFRLPALIPPPDLARPVLTSSVSFIQVILYSRIVRRRRYLTGPYESFGSLPPPTATVDTVKTGTFLPETSSFQSAPVNDSLGNVSASSSGSFSGGIPSVVPTQSVRQRKSNPFAPRSEQFQQAPEAEFSEIAVQDNQAAGWTVSGTFRVVDTKGVTRSLSVSFQLWYDPGVISRQPWRVSIHREETPVPGLETPKIWYHELYRARPDPWDFMAEVYIAREEADSLAEGPESGYFSTDQGKVLEATLYRTLSSKIPQANPVAKA